MPYTIGEMAKKLNIPPSTLRYYDKEGLLPFIERSEGGIRLFKDSDYEWLALINCLKNTGMPIKDIKTFVNLYKKGDSTINERLSLIERQRQSVIEQIEQLNSTLKTLNYKKWYYETAKKAGTCSIHNTLSIEDVPKEFRTIFDHS